MKNALRKWKWGTDQAFEVVEVELALVLLSANHCSVLIDDSEGPVGHG
jgi:hypothetical protein